jgi:(p)ppGpp synthase/HD superfamily hydrolase
MSRDDPLMSPRLERAFRLAALRHAGQVRRGSGVPYLQHVASVALILDRLGYSEDVVIAGLLHDLVEDTETTLDEVRAEFGEAVAEIVGHGSEVKTDAEGRKRPWIDRKRDHLAALASASPEARAVVLADKLHNLLSIEADLADGRDVWTSFHADREMVLWYYRSMLDVLGAADPPIETLVQQCQEVLERIVAQEEESSSKSAVDR